MVAGASVASHCSVHRQEGDGEQCDVCDGGCYISQRYYERFPPSSPDTFKLTAKLRTENAEGLFSREVAVSNASVRRSARDNASSLASHLPLIVTMDEAERTKLDDLPTLKRFMSLYLYKFITL